jgi:hypothetical protein
MEKKTDSPQNPAAEAAELAAITKRLDNYESLTERQRIPRFLTGLSCPAYKKCRQLYAGGI